MIAKYKIPFSIFIIWLFNISGILGILSSKSEWFLGLTPLNLLLYLAVIVFNLEKPSPRFIIAFSIPFFIGFITEFLGVNYGLFFGNYSYGNNLGFKIGGVPLMICVNWGVLTVVTAELAKQISKNIFLKAFIASVLMVFLDIIIEVSAPRFDFWEFQNNNVPLKNYIAWLVISFIAHLGYHKFAIKVNTKVAVHLFSCILLFFSIFLFF